MNIKLNKTQKERQQGAVSLFIVIFTSLLVTVLTVSFVQIMLSDQQQAMTTDLSQSAYDSASAGVEDAKRLLIENQRCINDNSMACQNIRQALEDHSDSCDLLDQAGISDLSSGETLLSQVEGDEKLDQAYTCVKVTMNTPDYLGHLEENEPSFIPLRGVGDFNRVRVEWFSRGDLAEGSTAVDSLTGSTTSLPRPASWPANRPPVLRAQMIQHTNDSNFGLNSFNGDIDNRASNSHALFLFPRSTGINSVNFSRDHRHSQARTGSSAAPLAVRCLAGLSDEYYACTMTFTIPSLIEGSGSDDDKSVYLILNAFYNSASYRVTLLRGSSSVDFDGVQPAVDSTGRANDLFRRVESRVQLHDTTFPFPRAALDIEGELCKDFMVTDRADDYDRTNQCATP